MRCDLIAWILSQDGCVNNTVKFVVGVLQTCVQWCTSLQHSDYKLHTTPCGRNRWNLFDDALRSSCRLRLCYYVVGSPSLPPFVRPGRARASDRRRADDLPAGRASAAPSALSSGDDPASAHHSTTPNSSRFSLPFVGSCCSTKQFSRGKSA